MSDGTYRQLAASVLVAHQRRDDSNCLCGTLMLGESWANHVAWILDRAGALAAPPADVVGRVPFDVLARELARRGYEAVPP